MQIHPRGRRPNLPCGTHGLPADRRRVRCETTTGPGETVRRRDGVGPVPLLKRARTRYACMARARRPTPGLI